MYQPFPLLIVRAGCSRLVGLTHDYKVGSLESPVPRPTAKSGGALLTIVDKGVVPSSPAGAAS